MEILHTMTTTHVSLTVLYAVHEYRYVPVQTVLSHIHTYISSPQEFFGWVCTGICDGQAKTFVYIVSPNVKLNIMIEEGNIK